MTTDRDKKGMHERLVKRQKKIEQWILKQHDLVDRGKIGGEPGRQWLEKWTVGVGLNIACGDFPIGESIGVDFDYSKLAIDYWGYGDALVLAGDSLDYIVTNYFEAFPDVLKVLNDWHRTLRVGGVLAIVCANTVKYENDVGPLSNPKRRNCFTYDTLRCYLNKTGFTIIDSEEQENELRVAARKI